MSEPTKEALELAERIESSSYFEADFSVFNTTEAARKIDETFASLREELRAAREALEPAIKQIEDMLKTPIDVRTTETLEQYHKRDPMPGRHGIFLTFDQMLALRAACKGGDAV